MRLSKTIVLFFILLALLSSARADTPAVDSPEILPRAVGKYRKARVLTRASATEPENLVGAGAASDTIDTQIAEYAGSNGFKASVQIERFRQDAYAYQALSILRVNSSATTREAQLLGDPGTAGFQTPAELAFCKGAYLVRIKNTSGRGSISLLELAQGIGSGLDKGEGDVPVLVKHLPTPDEAQRSVVYLNSFVDQDLSKLPLQNQSVFTAINSGGNADAAVATYGASKLLIIEFNTPQLAADNDRRIISRIQELWKLGEPAPAYRRVGNYSVFVFDAPDEPTARQLIDQVKYEQVVQWLGENPNIFKEAERRYINTTLGVLVAVLKASGYALVTCLGLGGLFGGLLFSYRRSQQKAVTAFSDAGGMLRLNLDDMTPKTEPSRLLQERN